MLIITFKIKGIKIFKNHDSNLILFPVYSALPESAG